MGELEGEGQRLAHGPHVRLNRRPAVALCEASLPPDGGMPHQALPEDMKSPDAGVVLLRVTEGVADC